MTFADGDSREARPARRHQRQSSPLAQLSNFPATAQEKVRSMNAPQLLANKGK